MRMSSLLGEAMKQRVQTELVNISNDNLQIYNTVQMATEIEACKKQERALMAKVEQQQYVEAEMKSELDSVRQQLEEGQEFCRDKIMKM